MNPHERSPLESPERGEPNEVDRQLKNTAEQFVRGDIIKDKKVVHEGDVSTIYACFELPVSLPSISGVNLRLDYRQYHASGGQGKDQVRFEFTAANEKGNHVPFTEMHLRVVDSRTFDLEHRYVQPEYRNERAMGSRLLKVAERWLQDVADIKQDTVHVFARVGQKSVMNWLEKNGFSVAKKDEETFRNIKEHPEQYVEDAVWGSTNPGLSHYLFPQSKANRSSIDAIRLT